MKHISILGSTGSIGVNTLGIIQHYPDRFKVVGLAAGSNIDLLEEQCRRFKPQAVSLKDEAAANQLKHRLGQGTTRVYWGAEGLNKIAVLDEVQMVVSAMVGSVGLLPTLAAIEAKKDIALANKEILVMAGELMMQKAAEAGVNLVPVDSEHSAIFQCSQRVDKEEIRRIILTASGGPFADLPASRLAEVTPEQALRHPTWNMGHKISVDSASLMNKGLEVIEAQWLFNIGVDRIEVLIHPQSVVHSMIELTDGTLLAQLGITDMRIPILYALSYPERLPNSLPALDLTRFAGLSFSRSDTRRFPCLKYAYQAARTGGSQPAVLNAANEVAVTAFLNKEIGFTDIPYIVKQTMDNHQTRKLTSIQQALNADAWARSEAQSQLAAVS
jgi:1-deoxy-D-xylulose-5-phosphate reductoisomerase